MSNLFGLGSDGEYSLLAYSKVLHDSEILPYSIACRVEKVQRSCTVTFKSII